MKLYVTYGCGTNLKQCYSVVEAEDFDIAIEAVFAGTRGRHSTTYSEDRFAGMVEKWGLREVPLQPCYAD